MYPTEGLIMKESNRLALILELDDQTFTFSLIELNLLFEFLSYYYFQLMYSNTFDATLVFCSSLSENFVGDCSVAKFTAEDGD